MVLARDARLLAKKANARMLMLVDGAAEQFDGERLMMDRLLSALAKIDMAGPWFVIVGHEIMDDAFSWLSLSMPK